MCISILSMCRYVYHVCAWYLSKSEEDRHPLDMELQVIVSHHVSVGINPKISARAANCS